MAATVSDGRLVVTSGNDPALLVAKAGRDAARRAAAGRMSSDLLAEHGALLGEPVDACIASAANPELVGTSGAFLTRLERGQAWVRATTSGLAGDIGLRFAGYALFLSGRDHAPRVE